MKIETSPVSVLDSFTTLRSKSYSFSLKSVVQKAKQKGYKKPLNGKITYAVCLILNVQDLQIIHFVQTYINYQFKNKRN